MNRRMLRTVLVLGTVGLSMLAGGGPEHAAHAQFIPAKGDGYGNDQLTFVLPPLAVKDQKTPAVWDGHTSHIRGVHFTDDGKYVVSISGNYFTDDEARKRPRDNTLRVWDPRTGKELVQRSKTPNFKEALDGCSVSPGGKYAIFGYGGFWEGGKWVDATDSRVRLWDIEKNKEIFLEQRWTGKDWLPELQAGKPRFAGLDHSVRCSALSSDRRRVMAGEDEFRFFKPGEPIRCCLAMWDSETGGLLYKVSVPPDVYGSRVFPTQWYGVDTCIFTPDGRYVILSCFRQLRVLEAATGRDFNVRMSNHQDMVWALAAFQTKSGQLLALSGGGGQPVGNDLAFGPGARDYAIRLWNLAQGTEIRRFSGHEDEVRGLAFCPNGRHCVSASKDQTIRLWDMTTGNLVRILGKHDKGATCITVSPDGHAAVSGGFDCNLRYWRLPAPAQDLAQAIEKNDLDSARAAIKDIDALGEDPNLAFAPLLKCLSHENAEFRKVAEEALLNLALTTPTAAVAAPDKARLLSVWRNGLKSESPRVQRASIANLGSLDTDAKAAIDDLLPLLQAQDKIVKFETSIALVRIDLTRSQTEKAVLSNLVRALEVQSEEELASNAWKDRCTRARAAILLLGAPAAKELASTVVQGGYFQGAQAAKQLSRIEVYRTIESLGTAAKPETLRLLEAVRLEDGNRAVDPKVKQAARQALGALNNAKK